jgi:hypothetical protein
MDHYAARPDCDPGGGDWPPTVGVPCYNCLVIDTSFDFGSEPGRDPDTHSPTLRRYHRLLWSKPLPSGAMFDLVEAGRKGNYHLQHSSEVGQFKLSSDAITNRLKKRARRVIAQIPSELMPPHRGYTIGSALLFPVNAPPGYRTINQARGLNGRIADRFDLTLECIRRHYLGEHSPLAANLAAYTGFFALFENFDNYVAFWLLQDLVEDGQVRFWLPFDDFKTRAVPREMESYLSYRQRMEDFITARNRRIQEYARIHL